MSPRGDRFLKNPRVRVFVALSAVLVAFTFASLFATRQALLFARQDRVTDTLSQAVAVYRAEVDGVPQNRRAELIRAVETAAPDLPGDTRLWLFVDGERVASTADGPGDALPATGPWTTASRSLEGQVEHSGRMLAYVAVPIIGAAQTQAALVATTPLQITPSTVQRAVNTVAAVLALLLIPALLLAWWLSGRVVRRDIERYRRSPTARPRAEEPPPPPRRAHTRSSGPAAITATTTASASEQPSAAAAAQSGTAPPPTQVDAARPRTRRITGLTTAPVTRTETPDVPTAPVTRVETPETPAVAAAVTRSAPDPDTGATRHVTGPVALSRITLDIYAAAQRIDDREWILDVPSTATVRVDPATVVRSGALMARFTAALAAPDAAVVVGADGDGDEARIYVHALGPAGIAAPDLDAPSTAELLEDVSRVAAAHGGEVRVQGGQDGPPGIDLVLPQP